MVQMGDIKLRAVEKLEWYLCLPGYANPGRDQTRDICKLHLISIMKDFQLTKNKQDLGDSFIYILKGYIVESRILEQILDISRSYCLSSTLSFYIERRSFILLTASDKYKIVASHGPPGGDQRL